MTKKQTIGIIGENIAERFLVGKGYEILERNYKKFHGEIDIIAKDLKEIVFVEVKTISVNKDNAVTRETYRPEYNIGKEKIRIVSRTAKFFMSEKHSNNNWRIDVVAVELEQESKKAKIRHLKSVYL